MRRIGASSTAPEVNTFTVQPERPERWYAATTSVPATLCPRTIPEGAPAASTSRYHGCTGWPTTFSGSTVRASRRWLASTIPADTLDGVCAASQRVQ